MPVPALEPARPQGSFPIDEYQVIVDSAFDWNARDLTVTNAAVDRLTERLAGALPAEHLKEALQRASRALQRAARAKGWTLKALPQYAMIERERSAIVDLWLAGNPLPALKNKLVSNLGLPEQASAVQGQVLLSAIICGGLINHQWWQPLLDALRTPGCHLVANGGRLCFLLQRTSDASRPFARRGQLPAAAQEAPRAENGQQKSFFWVADAVSEILIRRAWVAGAFDAPVGVEEALEAFHGDKNLPVKRLARAARDHLMLRLPPLLVAHASGKLVSTDAAPATLAQLLTNRPLVGFSEKQPDATSRRALAASAMTRSPRQGGSDSIRRQYQRLRSAMGKRTGAGRPTRAGVAGNIESYLVQNGGGLHPIISDIAHWSIWMLRTANEPASQRTAYKVSTVKSYLSSIGPALLAHVLSDDLTTYRASDIEELYDLIVSQDSLAPAEQGRRATALGLFHQSLMERYPDIIVPVEGRVVRSGGANVDANLVSLAAYNAALAELDRVEQGVDLNRRRLPKLRCLALALGYRGGLRWSEASLIAINEFVGEGREIELHIRTNAQRGVKSAAGRRIVPIGRLLPSRELQLLEAMLKLRCDEVRTAQQQLRNALLFATPSGDKLEAEVLFNPIQRALQTASGNPQATFHHCRHAFASRLMAMLLLRDRPAVWSELPGLGLDERWELESDERLQQAGSGLKPCASYADMVDAVRRWTIGVSPSNRQVAYVVAQLVGHESPVTTFASYIHIMGWVLGCWMDRLGLSPFGVIQQAAQLWPKSEPNKRTLKRFTRQHPDNFLSQEDFVLHCLEKWRRLELPCTASPLPAVRSNRGRPRKMIGPQPTPVVEFPSIVEVARLLTQAEPQEAIVINGQRMGVSDLRAISQAGLKGNTAALARLATLKPPLRKSDRMVANRLWEAVANENNFGVRWRIRGFSALWQHYRDDRTFRFEARGNKLKPILEFLNKLGVSSSHIRMEYRTAMKAGPKAVAKMRQQLENSLGLTSGSINLIPDQSARQDSISLKVVNPVPSGQKTEASYGFLYVCLLLYSAGLWQQEAKSRGQKGA